MDSPIHLICTYNKEPFTKSYKNKIKEFFQNYDQFYFWIELNKGYIRLDALKYIISKKYIDIDDTEIKNELLESFTKMLENSGRYNVHETILFLFDLLKYDIINYKNNYNISLFHFVFYGYDDERKEEYIDKLLSIGYNKLSFVNPKNIETFKKNIHTGQSPIYLACIENKSILEKLLKLDKNDSEIHMSSYDIIDNCYMPIVLALLNHFAKAKDPEWFNDVAQTIKMLISYGYDINLKAYSIDNNCHNITDYLNYYQYDYENSPIMQMFRDLNIVLPKSLDPEFKYFKEKDEIMTRYEAVYNKYKYVKDMKFISILIDELEGLLKEKVRYICDVNNWWLMIPEIREFDRKAKEIQKRLDEEYYRMMNTDARTEFVYHGV